MAKRGWQPISANSLMQEWVKSHWSKYVEGRAEAGVVAHPNECELQKVFL
jgi:hypothetical protein